jgi:D-cysteine desulfhydrase family pyridoxal phosphate-dependent enzyme
MEIDMSAIAIKPLKVAHLPTPIDFMPRLSQELGIAEIHIKRDDQTGLAFGGNKTRKLEFLLGDAKSKGSQTLITRGAAQSNHCRQTAAAAARFGFDCALVLTGEEPEKIEGNLLLDQLFGAQIHWTMDQDPEVMLQSIFDDLEARGASPYLIPYGGSNEIGAYAYVEAMREFLSQDPDFDHIFLATSSGGTQAGLCLGALLHNYRGSIRGISVDLNSKEIQNKVSSLSNQTSSWMGSEVRIREEDVLVHDGFLGGGYGVVSNLEVNAIETFARLEGIVLDPVYTARAAGGMMELIKQGEIAMDSRVLFWHTGGIPSLFAYEDELLP